MPIEKLRAPVIRFPRINEWVPIVDQKVVNYLTPDITFPAGEVKGGESAETVVFIGLPNQSRLPGTNTNVT